MKYLLTFGLALFLFSACKKGQADFIVSGTIMDESSQQPLAQAMITVVKISVENGGEEPVTTVMTDGQGRYSFTVKRDRFLALQLNVTKSAYFSIDKKIDFSQLTTKEENTVDLSTFGKSWVKIHLKHTESADTKLNLFRTEGKSDCAECCPSGTQQFVGIIDTTFYCINNANRPYKVTYYKVGASTTDEKSVTTIFNDTVTMNIVY